MLSSLPFYAFLLNCYPSLHVHLVTLLMFLFLYILLDATACCSSEANLSEFLVALGSTKTYLLHVHTRFLLSQLPWALGNVIDCQPGLIPFNQTVDFTILQCECDSFLGDSVECAGPQKHTGESPVFLHYAVLNRKLFFLISSSKASCLVEASRLVEELSELQLYHTIYKHQTLIIVLPRL